MDRSKKSEQLSSWKQKLECIAVVITVPLNGPSIMFLVLFLLAGFSIASGLVITSDSSSVSGRQFDYVVVGGGTAGLVVASRLAEIPSLRILVIEAGPDAQNDSDVNDPAQFITLAQTGKYNWGFVTTPQAAGGITPGFTQGKVLGGSSAINGMDWGRASISQYDALEELGNPGWNWDSMLHYMKKSEHFFFPNANQTALGASALPQFHGFNGPLKTGFPQPYLGPQSVSLLTETFEKVIPSITKNPDVSSGTPGGVVQWPYSLIPAPNSETTPGGNIRSSSARGYIYPFETGPVQKKGLTILVEHLASRIIWSDASSSLPKATGVEFIATPASNTSAGATNFNVSVMKEVIVASGGIGSPHFLELSGIGDPKILNKAGIASKVNLPSVGTNFQDQPQIGVAYLVSPDVPPEDIITTNNPGTVASALIDIQQLFPGNKSHDIAKQLLDSINDRAKAIVNSGAFTTLSGIEKILTLQAKEISELKGPILEFSYGVLVEFGATLTGGVFWGLLPQARGTVHTVSSDPAVPPILNPNYLTTAFDLEVQLAAFKLTRTVYGTSPMAGFVTAEAFPGFALIPQNASDEQILAFIEGNYTPTTHPLGAVSMLPHDQGGAVDSELKVYGTQNVRVVDASIIPFQLSAHLSATVYGVAEKAADIIKSSIAS